jgi:ABC-type multidrug transport system fused ATPase/permease subunit
MGNGRGRLSEAVGQRELAAIVWRERGVLLLALACAVLGPVAALGIPFGAKLVLDEVIGQDRAELLLPVALGTGLTVLLQAGASYGAAQAGSVAGQRAVARIRQRVQRHALSLPVGYFDSTPTGTLVARCMADADQLRTLFGLGLIQVVSGLLTAALAFAVLAWIDPRLAALVAAVLTVGTIVLSRGFRVLGAAFRSMSECQGEIAGHLTEVFGGIRVVKSAGGERREALAFVRQSHRLLRASVIAHRHVAGLGAAIALASGAVSLGLLVLGGQAVSRGNLTVGDLALFLFLVGLLSAPLIQLAALATDVSRAIAASVRVREFLSLPTESHEDRAKIPIRRLVGTVVFDRVSYRYGAGPLVLRDVSFVARAGSLTALVGPNGAGKSTLMGLLLGFDSPSKGWVRIDGHVLSVLRVRDYRRHVAVVLQRDQLINGTIAENIMYGRLAASRAEVQAAAHLAHCDDFIATLPEGYDALVGERGIRLSAGQRQRIAIARAFLADPRILLLDEALVHLDAESEGLIQKALASLCLGRTTFMVAHRDSSIQRADQILVLQSGTVVERGTHEELTAHRGNYWRLRNGHAAFGRACGIEGQIDVT